MTAAPDTFAEKLSEVADIDVVPIRVAARRMGVKPSTIGKYIRDGMPVERAGRSGRGNGALVRLSTVRLWRAFNGHADDLQDLIADSAADVIGGHLMARGKPISIPELIAKCDTSDQSCAVFTLFLCDRVGRRITGHSPRKLSRKLQRILMRNMTFEEAETLKTLIEK